MLVFLTFFNTRIWWGTCKQAAATGITRPLHAPVCSVNLRLSRYRGMQSGHSDTTRMNSSVKGTIKMLLTTPFLGIFGWMWSVVYWWLGNSVTVTLPGIALKFLIAIVLFR